MNRFKLIMIGVFNASVWSFILYLIFAAFSSLVSWSNCFDITEWDSGGRGIYIIVILMIYGACVPFKSENKQA